MKNCCFLVRFRQNGAIAALGGLVLAIALASSAEAQSGGIRGHVVDAATSAPIPNATVSVLGTASVVRTDEQGRFELLSIASGRYEVEARRLGSTTSRQVVFVREGQISDVTLRLSEVAVSLARVEVVGAPADALTRLPGSAAVVSAHELALRQPISANEVLRNVLGVHVQEEEGVGLRSNVGVRGLDPDRSRTLLVLEDGVPVALAPYGEPEMYYSPPIDRMERVELVKGSGSVLFGPQTIGGVLNYVTADPPTSPAGSILAQGGDHQLRLLRASYGGAWRNARGLIGLLDKRAGDLAGLRYAVRDVTAKVGFKTAAGDFGLKSSLYDETSNSTYVGLTEAMYRADPFQHPAPDDRLDVERQALTVSHQVELRGSGEIRTNAYAYHTERNWRRQDYGFSSDSSAHVFRGTTGNRNREFHVVGLEPRLRLSWAVAGFANDLETGARIHYERARDRHIDGAIATASTGILRDDELREGRALAAFAQNRLFLGSAWHITPGIRLERFSYDRRIITTRVRRQDPAGTTRAPEDVDLRSSDDLFEVIPGIGTAWSPSATATVFAGVHRGFAPPRVKDALIYPDPTLGPGQQVPQLQTLHLDAERSVNYELGVRVGPRPYLALEATAFYLDFSNQIIAPSLSAGAVSQATLANQGATRHRGLEGSITVDVGKALRQPFGLIARLGATHVNATFSRDRYIRAASGDTVNVRGNRLPYAPRLTASGSVTLSAGGDFEARFDGLYVSDQFADNFETVDAAPTGLVGRIPSYRVYDLSLRHGIPLLESASLSASIKNLFGTRYIASRRPEGIKPGIPRTAFVGLSLGF